MTARAGSRATSSSGRRDHEQRRREAAVRDRYGLFVGGGWSAAADGATMPVVDPTSEGVLAEVAAGSRTDVDRAVRAARGAALDWAGLGWQRRGELLRRLADRIDEHSDELARLDAVDGGIPLDGMVKDVANASAMLRYHAGIASEAKGQTIEVPGEGMCLTLRQPYGVVGRIVPFNHPIQFAGSGIAAPLATGNTVVLKPADQTPLSALRLAELAADLLPSGVLNVVTGDATVGAALVEHPGVPRIAFTGSVRSGRAVMRAAAEHLKAVTLELGGKNPMVVLPDVDLAKAAGAAVQAMNFHRGQAQSCGSPSRVLVHESVRTEFVERLVALVEELTIGDPLDNGVAMGPLAFQAHQQRVLSWIDRGRDEGARLVSGGGCPPGFDTGWYVAPTVFDDVDPAMDIAREEIFGPVISVLGWSDETEALRICNELPVGLTANVWTADVSSALRFARGLEAGYVWVNGQGQRPLGAPFGGWKYSGLGSENGLDELLSFTRTKNVSISPVAARSAS